MENDVIDIRVRKRMLTAHGPMDLAVETTVEMGKLVALFGDSGAGKTTLLRILAGLTDPDEGQIHFGDTVWFDSEKKINVPPQQRNISLMFQDYALFPNMTIEENIAFAQPRPNSNEVEELLRLFGLTELQKRKPSGLSGGQRQRVALARALARKPQMLLLDEPLSSLNAEMRLMLQDEIEKVHRQWGITTVLVTHDLNEVFRLASQVIHLENGSIKRTGTPESVFSDTSISGKVQITGQIARIDRQDVINIVTVIVGGTQIIKVIAFDSDLENLKIGDHVTVFSKAFNPIVYKLK
ncbi:MAG: ATP-binding cassette domain-containing protein [Prolixibacteraceae bacterium]|nr:ATP-binding cassette domain-containing protein [Prolixibacteraceae bacterium]